MRIAILSRGRELYSTQRLLRAASSRGHETVVLDIFKCRMLLKPQSPDLYYNGKVMRMPEGVVARIGHTTTEKGSAILRQFELLHIPSTLPADALLLTHNKLACFQKAEMVGIPYPPTVYSSDPGDIGAIIKELGLPIVLKLLSGTHGNGVQLLTSEPAVLNAIELLNRLQEPFLFQKFIKEAAGSDIRAIVVGGQVIASMKREARPGDFRANLHRGGKAKKITLSKAEEDMAIQAAAMAGMPVAGIDMIASKKGPLLLEINASPGLEGIEAATKVDVAGKIIGWLENENH